jgi:hypothetical protein
MQNLLSTGPDLDVVAKVLTGLAALGSVLFQGLRYLRDSRGRLHKDLELLGRLNENDPSYAVVKAHVDATIKRIYGTASHDASAPWQIYNRGDFLFGVTMFFPFAVATAYLLRDGFTWWGVGAGLIALGGVQALINAFVPPRSEPASPER